MALTKKNVASKMYSLIWVQIGTSVGASKFIKKNWNAMMWPFILFIWIPLCNNSGLHVLHINIMNFNTKSRAFLVVFPLLVFSKKVFKFKVSSTFSSFIQFFNNKCLIVVCSLASSFWLIFSFFPFLQKSEHIKVLCFLHTFHRG